MLKLLSGEILKKKTECLVVPVCEDADIYDDPAITALIEENTGLNEKLIEELNNYKTNFTNLLKLNQDIGLKSKR